jgi:hypothetical protein
VQIEQWALEKVLAALVGCGRKCKTCSDEILTTKQKQQNPKSKHQQKSVPSTALQIRSTKKRKYRLLSSCMDQDRFPEGN